MACESLTGDLAGVIAGQARKLTATRCPCSGLESVCHCEHRLRGCCASRINERPCLSRHTSERPQRSPRACCSSPCFPVAASAQQAARSFSSQSASSPDRQYPAILADYVEWGSWRCGRPSNDEPTAMLATVSRTTGVRCHSR